MTIKFYSPTGHDMHIALTTGHTCVITVEGNEIDPMFNREAIARGASTDKDATTTVQAAAPEFDRKQVIADAINNMMDGNDPDDFNDDGKPNLKKLSARAGFKVERGESDAIFEEITKPE